jgi:hypothetical protein
MKNIISRIVLYIIMIAVICPLLWKILIEPCTQLYAEHGFFGIYVYLWVLAAIYLISYIIVTFINWFFK